MDFLGKLSNLWFINFNYYSANEELTFTTDQQSFTQVECQCRRDAFVSKQGLRHSSQFLPGGEQCFSHSGFFVGTTCFLVANSFKEVSPFF